MERHESKHSNEPGGTAAIEAAMEAAIRAEQRRERLMIGAWVGLTVVALVGGVIFLESCGGSGSSPERTTSYPDASSSEPVAVASSTGGVEAGGVTEQGLIQIGDGSTHDPLSVPPDVIASVSDTVVSAGQPVEVTVEATPDVTEMALADGRGDAIPMVRDSSGLTWRANYRVPLRPRSERLGLSVTAKNQDHRWRRVWLFLEVGDGKPGAESVGEAPTEGGGSR